LALKIRRLDEIAVDDADVADAGADQMIRENGAESAASNYGDAGGEQASLAGFTDAGEKY
jgi:hypothetical protein